jgi:PAS domain S-box-containing protein
MAKKHTVGTKTTDGNFTPPYVFREGGAYMTNPHLKTKYGFDTKVRIPDNGGQGSSKDEICENLDVFHLLAENTSELILHFQNLPTFKVAYVSPSSFRITGYKPEEFYADQKLAIKCVHPEDIDNVKDFLDLNSPSSHEAVTMRWIHKSGRVIWTEQTKAVIRNKLGEPVDVYFICRDITARKQMEEALRESEERFSAAFRSSPNAICIISADDGKFTEINESFTRLTGYTREEAIGHNSFELGLWASQDDVRRMVMTMQKTGRIYNEEFTSRMKSGELRTGLFSAEIIDIGGKPSTILVITDITEQKRAEAALADEALRRRILIEQSRDGIVVLDQNGKVFEANHHFSQMLGYEPEETLGLHVWDWDTQWTKEQLLGMIESVDAAGDHFETYHQRKDGTIFDVEISTNGAIIAGQKLVFCVCRDITARKQMEAALRDSEEKFSVAFHASANAICITSLEDDNFIEINESFTRFTGYTREETIGHSAPELGLWVFEEELKQWLDTLQKDGRVYNQEFHSRRKSGEIRIGLSSAEIINIGGKPYRIVSIIDITERKRMETQLKLLSSVTQQVSDATIVADRRFKITYMNRAAHDLFGYSSEEALGKRLDFFDDAPYPNEVIREIREKMLRGTTWRGTTIKRRKDGSTFICDSHLSPLLDEDGHISSYIVVQRDITKQKGDEAKLQEQKQLIEHILTAMPEGVLVVNGAERVILANDASHKILHVGKRAIKNKLLKEIIPIDQLLKLYSAVKRGRKGNSTLEFRYQVKGSVKIIICNIIPMVGERTLLTFTDISREREEEEKLYLTDRLASIGEMAAGLAHELNNPLTGILALSQMLIDGDIQKEYQEDLECIYGEAKRAANIVKNVLLFTRNKTYESGQTTANEVIKDVLRLRHYEEKASNITVVTNLPEDLPDVSIDRFQLQQVFLNIILNAEAAIKEANRPGTLTVTTERSNSHVNIIFSDTGCGIKKGIIPRIFDPFFTTKEVGKGTGLGLSICYGIVVKHGGKISVKSQVNKGTTFTIRMPVAP